MVAQKCLLERVQGKGPWDEPVCLTMIKPWLPPRSSVVWENVGGAARVLLSYSDSSRHFLLSSHKNSKPLHHELGAKYVALSGHLG